MELLQNIIIPLITLLAGGGGIGWIFHIRETRLQKRHEAAIKEAEAHKMAAETRLQEVEVDNKVAEGYKELAREKQARIDKQDATIDRLNAKIDDLYVELNETREAKSAAVEALAIERMLRCDKVGCADRNPPFGTLTKLRDFLDSAKISDNNQ